MFRDLQRIFSHTSPVDKHLHKYVFDFCIFARCKYWMSRNEVHSIQISMKSWFYVLLVLLVWKRPSALASSSFYILRNETLLLSCHHMSSDVRGRWWDRRRRGLWGGRWRYGRPPGHWHQQYSEWTLHRGLHHVLLFFFTNTRYKQMKSHLRRQLPKRKWKSLATFSKQERIKSNITKCFF